MALILPVLSFAQQEFSEIKVKDYSPRIYLQRNTNTGGFIQGIQTQLSDGTDNWFFGSAGVQEWRVSKGNWENPKLSVHENGNVGIGTYNPQSKLDVHGVMTVGGNNANMDIINVPHSLDMLKNSGKLAIGWNLSGAGGETDFVANRGLGSIGGFHFYDYSNEGQRKQLFVLHSNGNAFINGKLEAKEMKVTNSPTADFVFDENYELPKVEDVERHIKEKKHLPEIASAKEMEKEGVNIGEFQIKLLQKIEELTLYIIDQNKLNKEQSTLIQLQSEQLKKQLKINNSLQQQINHLKTSDE